MSADSSPFRRSSPWTWLLLAMLLACADDPKSSELSGADDGSVGQSNPSSASDDAARAKESVGRDGGVDSGVEIEKSCPLAPKLAARMPRQCTGQPVRSGPCEVEADVCVQYEVREGRAFAAQFSCYPYQGKLQWNHSEGLCFRKFAPPPGARVYDVPAEACLARPNIGCREVSAYPTAQSAYDNDWEARFDHFRRRLDWEPVQDSAIYIELDRGCARRFYLAGGGEIPGAEAFASELASLGTECAALEAVRVRGPCSDSRAPPGLCPDVPGGNSHLDP